MTDPFMEVRRHRERCAALGAIAEMAVTKVHDDGWIEGYSAGVERWFATKTDRLLTVRGQGFIHTIDPRPETGDLVTF